MVGCQECGKEVSRLGIHWYNQDHYPDLSQYERDLLRGLLLGDGSVSKRCIRVTNTNYEFLKWVGEELGILSSSVKEYSDRWMFNSRSHPFFGELRGWYSSGSKRFPEDLELSPIMVKMWYCGDGNLGSRGNRAQISTANEADRPEYLKRLFADVGLYPTWDGYKLSFQLEEFVDYVGESIPGMRYKWKAE